jgi:hypothetical protein
MLAKANPERPPSSWAAQQDIDDRWHLYEQMVRSTAPPSTPEVANDDDRSTTTYLGLRWPTRWCRRRRRSPARSTRSSPWRRREPRPWCCRRCSRNRSSTRPWRSLRLEFGAEATPRRLAGTSPRWTTTTPGPHDYLASSAVPGGARHPGDRQPQRAPPRRMDPVRPDPGGRRGIDAIELNIYFMAADPEETGPRSNAVPGRWSRRCKGGRRPLAVKVGPYFSSMANMAGGWSTPAPTASSCSTVLSARHRPRHPRGVPDLSCRRRRSCGSPAVDRHPPRPHRRSISPPPPVSTPPRRRSSSSWPAPT